MCSRNLTPLIANEDSDLKFQNFQKFVAFP